MKAKKTVDAGLIVHVTWKLFKLEMQKSFLGSFVDVLHAFVG